MLRIFLAAARHVGVAALLTVFPPVRLTAQTAPVFPIPPQQVAPQGFDFRMTLQISDPDQPASSLSVILVNPPAAGIPIPTLEYTAVRGWDLVWRLSQGSKPPQTNDFVIEASDGGNTITQIARIIVPAGRKFETSFITLPSLSGVPSTPGVFVSDAAGKLYFPAKFGAGTDRGSIMSFDPVSKTFATIHAFTGADGSYPERMLTLGGDGTVYGTANGFVSPINATNHSMFSVRPDGGQFRVLWTGTNQFPVRPPRTPARPIILFEGSDGLLYGAMQYAFGLDRGYVFRLHRDGSGMTTLMQLPGPPYEVWSLMEASDGRLYGAAVGGPEGSTNAGQIFRLNRDGSGYSSLRIIRSDRNEAAGVAPLRELEPGILYGLVTHPNHGTRLFKIPTATGVSEDIAVFTGWTFDTPTKTADGAFWGVQSDVTNNFQLLFRLSGDGRAISTARIPGRLFNGNVVIGADDAFYTAADGGVLRISFNELVSLDPAATNALAGIPYSAPFGLSYTNLVRQPWWDTDLGPAPSGMTFGEDFSLRWTAAENDAGMVRTAELLLRDRDGAAQPHKLTWPIRVSTENVPPAITNLETRIVSPASPLDGVLSATDPDSVGVNFVWNVIDGPPGLSIGTLGATVPLHWNPQPSQRGRTWTVRVRVGDGIGFGTNSFRIVAQAQAPAIAGELVDNGQKVRLTITGTSDSTAEIEVSENLRDWVPLNRIALEGTTVNVEYPISQFQTVACYRYRIVN